MSGLISKHFHCYVQHNQPSRERRVHIENGNKWGFRIDWILVTASGWETERDLERVVDQPLEGR